MSFNLALVPRREISLFRQVPAGVPGSMRVLVNLLSAGVVAPPQ